MKLSEQIATSNSDYKTCKQFSVILVNNNKQLQPYAISETRRSRVAKHGDVIVHSNLIMQTCKQFVNSLRQYIMIGHRWPGKISVTDIPKIPLLRLF